MGNVKKIGTPKSPSSIALMTAIEDAIEAHPTPPHISPHLTLPHTTRARSLSVLHPNSAHAHHGHTTHYPPPSPLIMSSNT